MEENVKNGVDVMSMSADERKALLAALQHADSVEKNSKREVYESLRGEFMREVRERLESVVSHVCEYKIWLEEESKAFQGVMREYGQLRKSDQRSFTVCMDDFKLEVSSNNVKRFDERADMAAERLMGYLRGYVQRSEKGANDPMYQLAMSMLERNRQGDLDYKSISKLYELEEKFGDAEYSEIMQLFKESNTVMGTAVNYYFWRRDADTGVWSKVEPSFCRI